MEVNPLTTDWLTRPGSVAPGLQALRTTAGLSGRALADRLGWPQSKVSRVERGKQVPSDDDIEGWAAACGDPAAAAPLIDRLLQFRLSRLDYKSRAGRGGIAGIQRAYNRLTAKATSIRTFDFVLVPGLLQTADYARALFRHLAEMDPPGPDGAREDDDSIELAVHLRMERQAMLDDPGKRLEFLVGEAALRTLHVPVDVMAAQLDHLADAAVDTRFRFGIFPLGVPVRTAPQQSFELIDDRAISEGFLEDIHYTKDQASGLSLWWDRLWVDAVEGEEARALIVRAADALR